MLFAIIEGVPVYIIIVGVCKPDLSFSGNDCCCSIGNDVRPSLPVLAIVPSTSMYNVLIVNC